jgi:glutamate-1-semialdehyde 2,1-aminomutase
LPAQVYSIASLYQIFFTNENVTDYACAKHSDAAMFTAYFQELLKEGVFHSAIPVRNLLPIRPHIAQTT